MKRVTRLLISAGALAGSSVVPAPAFAANPPLTAAAGTAQVTTEDWCQYDQFDAPPPGQRRWVDQMVLNLVLRSDGRQRTVSLTSSPGEYYLSCSTWTLPGMTFSGTSTVGTSSAQEPASGWCRGTGGLGDTIDCTLSFVGHAPVIIDMQVQTVYEQCDGEGSPVPQPCYDTDVVAGAQTAG